MVTRFSQAVSNVTAAFNELHIAWKVALLLVAILGAGAKAAPYIALPSRVDAITPRMERIERTHDSLGVRFDAMQGDLKQTRCIVIAQASHSSYIPCLK